MAWRNRRNRFKFTEKRHSKRGIWALLFSLALLILYVVVIIRAYHTNGGLSAYYGSVGVCASLISIGMVVLASFSLTEEDSYPFFPRASLVASVLAAICWIGTYAFGMIG